MIKIERQVGDSRELIARLPERSGTYDTGIEGVGEIDLLVCPPNIKRGFRKFVLEGKIMESNCGRNGTSFRRVVKMPFSGKPASQDISTDESLVFIIQEP